VAEVAGGVVVPAGASPRRWLVLACVTFSLFMIMLDNTVVTVALPAIQQGLHASLSQLEWVVDAYSLAFAVFLLSGGKLADFLGRRRIFLVGILVFSLSSLWCALSTSGGMLITARGVQGFGAALMLPPTISIIAENFAPEERGLAFGIWAAISGAALSIGPLVGGILVQSAHWGWIFYINVPIGAIGIVSTLLLVKESRDTSAEQRLDVPGLLTSGAAMFALVFALIESNKRGWGSVLIIGCFVAAAVLIAAFVVVESRLRLPMLDLGLFKNRTFDGANAVGLAIMCSLFGFIFFMSLYLQNIRHYTPIRTGAIFLVSTVAMTAFAPAAGKLADRVGPRVPICLGLLLFGGSLVGLSVQLTATVRIWTLFPLLFVGGMGFGLVLPPATTAVVSSVPADRSGVASGMMQAIRQLGGALGIAIAGAIIASKTSHVAPRSAAFTGPFVGGVQDVLLFAGIVALVGAAVGFAAIESRAAEDVGAASHVAPPV
jgi:EmrB/QacA subfamily drug resistance transporter